MGQLNSYPTASTIDAVNDKLVIWTNSLSAVQNINRNTFLNLASQPVGLSDSQTLTNKTLTSPTINGATLSGTLSGTYTIGGTPTFPSSVTQNTTVQTLTNKTLTSPTINSPTITNATISADTLTGYTTSNSGTIYGVGITSGVFSTSNIIPTASIQNNAVTAAKLVNGIVANRQGGTTGAASWYTAGTSNTSVATTNAFIQTGVVIMNSAATVTFPVAFNQIPVVFVSPVTAGTQNCWARVQNITTTQFTGQAFINNTTGVTSESVAWIAIGQ